MTGECTTARGRSGTVMRHFLPTRAFAVSASVAALALGMTVSAASSALIPASRRTQRFTPSEAATTDSAVLLAPIAARAYEHLAPASGTQKQSGIVHRSPGGERLTILNHRAILHLEPYASADLGAASDVTGKSVESEAASTSSPIPISLQLTSAVIAGARGDGVL